MLPKLEEFSVDELKKQLDNKKIDKEFLIEYVVKRDKVYNKLIDEVNRLRIEVSSNEEYTSVYLKGCTDTKGKYLSQQKEFIEYLEDKLNMCDGFLDTIKSDLEEISYAGRIAGKNYIATQIMKNETSKKNYEEVLSKYKEIIGEHE